MRGRPAEGSHETSHVARAAANALAWKKIFLQRVGHARHVHAPKRTFFRSAPQLQLTVYFPFFRMRLLRTVSSMEDDAWLPPPSLGATLRQLHKQRRADIIAHLRSLDHDANFVAAVHLALGAPPTLANLRCGVWHVPPSIASFGHCYFKSTDGHAGQWDFSRTRLNLQVALAAGGDARGVVLVDSTRSGKRFPDALSKTVPIWCCVLIAMYFAYEVVTPRPAPWTGSASGLCRLCSNSGAWRGRIQVQTTVEREGALVYITEVTSSAASARHAAV